MKLQNKLTGLFFKTGENFTATFKDATSHDAPEVALIRAMYGNNFVEVSDAYVVRAIALYPQADTEVRYFKTNDEAKAWFATKNPSSTELSLIPVTPESKYALRRAAGFICAQD